MGFILVLAQQADSGARLFCKIMHSMPLRTVNTFSRGRRKQLKRQQELSATTIDETGKRIRSWRMERKLRQADLAKSVGISPSYLNLIEHNRRRIAGKLLADIAKALDVDPVQLASGAPSEVLSEMRRAAAKVEVSAEMDGADDMAARYPGWAELIGVQSRQIAALEAEVQALRNRMTHDPEFAKTLHEVLSSVTSIRSAASILTGEDALDPDWQQRFNKNIYADAVKLAEDTDALIRQLEAPGTEETAGSPIEVANDWLSSRGFHLAEIEDGADPAVLIEQIDLEEEAKSLLFGYISQYTADAAQMPLARFADAADDLKMDPVALADRFGASFDAVMRRLASLPNSGHRPPVGLAICGGGGVISFVKEVEELQLARIGGACPHWPLYSALGQPGRPIKTELELPGRPSIRLRCYAQANHVYTGFDAPPTVQSIMLVMPEAPSGTEEKDAIDTQAAKAIAQA